MFLNLKIFCKNDKKKLFYNIKLSQVLAAGTLIGLGWPIYSTEQLCVCVWLCVNVCVCVCERERERKREI
jgi:hypothetical protein